MALQDYSVSDPTLLPFNRGDVIKVLSRKDQFWLLGELNSIQGLVRVTYFLSNFSLNVEIWENFMKLRNSVFMRQIVRLIICVLILKLIAFFLVPCWICTLDAQAAWWTRRWNRRRGGYSRISTEWRFASHKVLSKLRVIIIFFKSSPLLKYLVFNTDNNLETASFFVISGLLLIHTD